MKPEPPLKHLKMSYALPYLVAEASRNQSVLLNLYCSGPPSEQDLLINEIWHVLQIFLQKDDLTRESELNVHGILFDQNQYRFTLVEDLTFSPSTLKTHLLMILGRLFEVCIPEDLPEKPWIQEDEMNIIKCIRKISSDAFLVLHVLGGLPFDEVYGLYPEGFRIAIRGAMNPFTMSENSPQCWKLFSDAKIFCTSVLKFGVPSILFESEMKLIFSTLIDYTMRRPSNEWPFMRTAAEFLQRLELPEEPANILSAKGFNKMKRIGLYICNLLVSNCEEIEEGHVELLVLAMRVAHLSEGGELNFISIENFSKIPGCVFEQSPDSWLQIFFFHFSHAVLRIEHLIVMRKIVSHTRSCDPTDLMMLALDHVENGICPIEFIYGMIMHFPNMDFSRILSNPNFASLMVWMDLDGSECRLSRYLFPFNILHSSTILEHSVASGMLSNLKNYEEVISFSASILVLHAMVYEDDISVIEHVICNNIDDDCDVWRSWMTCNAQAFFEKHLHKLGIRMIKKLIVRCSKGVLDDKVFILMRTLKRKTAIAILKDDFHFPLLREDQIAEIPWMKAQRCDNVKMRLRKDLVARKINIRDAILFILWKGHEKGRLFGTIVEKWKLRSIFRANLVYSLHHIETAASPMIAYASTLTGPHLKLPSQLPFFESDFLLLSRFSDMNIPSDCKKIVMEMSKLPASFFSRDPDLLVQFLCMFIEKPQEIKRDKLWVKQMASLAESWYSEHNHNIFF